MADPASALRADGHSSKQANFILRGVGLADLATTGGLTQKATDNPPLTAQWRHKKVWLAKTGHWAEYADLSVEQFVQGYLEIVLPTIPISPSTPVTRDQIGYLQHMMRDTSPSPWHLVRSTHKQILFMVEHKQLKWEDTATRNSIRAAQLLLAKVETMQAKFLGIPDQPQTKAGKKKPPVKEESGKPCPAYQSNTCSYQKTHVVDGTNMLHYCQYCFSHRNHRFSHPQTICNKRGSKA